MDQLVIVLIVILFPGIIGIIICDTIVDNQRKLDSFKYGLYALVLGILCYVILQLIRYLFDIAILINSSESWNGWSHLFVWNVVADSKNAIQPIEIILASAISIPVAALVSKAINSKMLNRIAQNLEISDKYGDENLFSFFLNAEETNWVYVRDPERNFTYRGQVFSFSENDHIQELVLVNVTVFQYEDSKELYSLPSIYLSKEAGKFIIEGVEEDLDESALLEEVNNVKETSD